MLDKAAQEFDDDEEEGGGLLALGAKGHLAGPHLDQPGFKVTPTGAEHRNYGHQRVTDWECARPLGEVLIETIEETGEPVRYVA